MKPKSKFRATRMIFISIYRFLVAWDRYKTTRAMYY